LGGSDAHVQTYQAISTRSPIFQNTWGCIKKMISVEMTQNHVIVFFFLTLIVFAGGEPPVDKKCDVSSFMWV
jgi:hypothetical protein